MLLLLLLMMMMCLQQQVVTFNQAECRQLAGHDELQEFQFPVSRQRT